MISQIFSMLGHFLNSFGDTKGSAWKYMIYSGLIAVALLTIMVFGIWKLSAIGGAWIASLIPWQWAHETVLFSFVIGIAFGLLCWIVMKYIMLIMMSPLLSLVSEKLEQKIKGVPVKSRFNVAGSLARTIRVNSRNLLREVVFSVFLLLASLIPVLNVFAIALLFLLQAYFVGFGIMDYYLERHYTYRETVTKVYQHKWAAITLGAIFIGMILIPVIGAVMASYFTTVAATRYFSVIESEQTA
ncbi:MAG: EI24 domain-containing protein [Saprospiraceae bacterium]|nr:MAG: Etoposide-induced protein 2.4 (EI24) [Bacteroidetes bacterium OLB9]MCO6463863.1 EI24 domain-containing protein [Saprospiraceae bacterium]MCZ2339908.1 EI24 domain-containing protein [Chitinophagales bacterium]